MEVLPGSLSDVCAAHELLGEAGVTLLPVALWPSLALSHPGLNTAFHNFCCFSHLKFWFLTSGNHTKPQREPQLKPPGFTCFHNKTKRGAKFALERFGDLWMSFHSTLNGCEHLPSLLAPEVVGMPWDTGQPWEKLQSMYQGLSAARDTCSPLPFENAPSVFWKIIL